MLGDGTALNAAAARFMRRWGHTLDALDAREALPPAEPPDLLPEQPRRRFCGACQVGWTGGPVCWCCGKAGR